MNRVFILDLTKLIGFYILYLVLKKFIYMFTPKFEKCVSAVLRSEGGYINDPDDSGGETNYGISKSSFPGEDIKNMTIERAKEIYKAKYWDKLGCESIEPINLAFQLFDFGVNAGINQSLKTFSESGLDLEVFKRLRRDFYISIANKKNNAKYLNGWLKRVNKTV